MLSSSHSGGVFRLPSDLGHKDSPYADRGFEMDAMTDFNMFPGDQDETVPIALRFDEFGNLIGIDENEPELPALPGFSTSRPATAGGHETTQNTQELEVPIAGDDGTLLMEKPPLPDAEGFPIRQPLVASESFTTESVETGRGSAKNKRANRRKPKVGIMLDNIDKVSRDEFKSWSRDYVEIMEASQKQRMTTTLAEARKNARAFISGNGVADVGNANVFGGVVHPLASHFAGDSLESLLQGREPLLEPEKKQRGRRRKSEEAFRDEYGENGRRVKQKMATENRTGLGLRDDDGDSMMLGDDTVPEVGMEPMSAMAERHSSTMMPWSRPGSAVPGSAVRGSAQKLAPAPSPLLGRGRLVSDIDRQSDSAVQPSNDLAQHHLMGRSSTPELPAGLLDGLQVNTDFGGLATLDIASQDFLSYMADRIKELGKDAKSAVQGGNHRKNWVNFEQLADPAIHTKAVAAQAFLHVLSLATKNVIDIEQDGGADFIPFGPIRVGISGKLTDNALLGVGHE
jgi:hypothetical protein